MEFVVQGKVPRWVVAGVGQREWNLAIFSHCLSAPTPSRVDKAGLACDDCIRWRSSLNSRVDSGRAHGARGHDGGIAHRAGEFDSSKAHRGIRWHGCGQELGSCGLWRSSRWQSEARVDALGCADDRRDCYERALAHGSHRNRNSRIPRWRPRGKSVRDGRLSQAQVVRSIDGDLDHGYLCRGLRHSRTLDQGLFQTRVLGMTVHVTSCQRLGSRHRQG